MGWIVIPILALRLHADSDSGDRYSSEWYWAKLLKLAETNDAVAREIGDWVEIADWIPAVLCATTAPGALKPANCRPKRSMPRVPPTPRKASAYCGLPAAPGC